MKRFMLLGTAAGLFGGFVMDGVTTLFMQAQSESLKREEAVRGESQPKFLARRVGCLLGWDPSDRAVDVAGTVVHRMTGIAAGPFIAFVAARRGQPLRDATIAALLLWLLFDEGVSWAMDMRQARSFPTATHMRGLLGHLGYGLTIGLIARAVPFASSTRY